MTYMNIRIWLVGVLTLLLVGCGGGGGDAGSAVLPGTGGGGTGGPTVTLSISSATVTPASPATVTVTVRDASGNPVAGTVVDLKTERGTFATLSVSSVATNASGTATVLLAAGAGGLSGADQVVGVAKLGTTTVQGSVSFSVSGGEPTISLSISSATLRGASGPETAKALVKDAAGNPVANTLVTFSATGGRVKLGAPSAKTDVFGVASVSAAVVDTTLTAADTLTASASVGATKVISSLVVQLVADTPSLLLTASNSNITSILPVTLSVQVSDSNGKPVGAGTVVSLTSAFGLTAFDATTIVTNASGVAQALLTPKTATSNGADQIVASASVAGTPVLAQVVLQVSSSALTSVTVTVAPTLITNSTPATVSAFVRDARGSPLAGAIVDFSTVRGGVGNLSVASAATDANGLATATLSAANAGKGGADQVVAVVRSGTTSVQGSASFTVAGSLATASLKISSPILKGSTGSATLTANIKDPLGNPVSNTLVTFASAGGTVKLGATSAVSNAAGDASISVAVSDSSLTVAETLTATATVGSVQTQATLVVQLVADVPTMDVSASSAVATSAAPSVLTIVVKDATGRAVGAGTVVNVSSVFALSVFDAVTVVTDASGVAQVAVTPKSATSNGADQIVVTATVGGVTLVSQTVLQIQNATLGSVTVAISSGTVTTATPATVTVTVRDAAGKGVPGALVDLSTSRGGYANLGSTSVATNAAGTATTTLTAVSAGLSGADQVVGVVKLGATSLQGLASFTVAGNVSTIGLTISSTTLRGSTGQASLKAAIKDANGNPVPNVLVSFSSGAGRVLLAAPAAMTDSAGVAAVLVGVADAAVTAADTLTATATLGSGLTQSSLVVQLLADIPTLKIATNNTNVTTLNPATLTFMVKDGAGNAVGAGYVVSVTSVFGLSSFDANTVVTNSSGQAQVVVSPKTATSNGADRILASTAVAGVTASDQLVLQIQASISTSVAVELSSSTVTAASPATVTVTVRDAKGQPVPGAVVDLSMVRGGLATLNVSSVATTGSGSAIATLSASGSGLSGADQVVGVVRGGAATAQGIAGFTVTGSVPTLNLSVSSNTIKNSTGPATVSATVRDAGGNLQPNVQVTFTSGAGRVKLGSPSALTNGSGVASILVTSVDPSITAADTVTASALVGVVTVQSTLSVQMLADTATLKISASNTNVTTLNPATLTFTVKDSAGNAVGAGYVVNVSSAFDLSSFDSNTVVTNASGQAQVVVSPKAASSNGADRITASTSVGGVAASDQFVLQIQTSTSTSVAVDLSSRTLTASSPVTVTVTVRDAKGQPMTGAVVDLSTVRGGLANLNVSSVATNGSGMATAILTAGLGGLSGADQVVGVVRGGATTAQGVAGFAVAGSVPTLNVAVSSSTLKNSTGPVTVSATVRDAGGTLQPNVQVTFVSGAGRIKLGAPTALTNSSGIASILVTSADASVTAADTVTASALVGAVSVQSTVAVQLLADAVTLKITASNVNVTTLNPATLTFTVKDSTGAPVGAGYVVSVSSAFDISSFDANTVVTNASGQAQVVVSPKTATSNGADRITATTSVGGVTASDQFVLQIQTSTSTSVAVNLSSATLTAASPVTVTVTVRDAKGQPMTGAVVDLSTVRGGLANLSVSSVATNGSGMATALLTAGRGGLSGADQVVGVVRGGAATAQGVAGFSVAGSVPTLNMSVSSTTLKNSTGPVTVNATVRDAGGNLQPNVQVTFTSGAGRIKLGAPTALTDSSGLASILVTSADASITAADTITASALVGAATVQGTVAIQLLADTPSITISGNSAVTASAPSTLSFLIKDSAGLAVGQGVVVRVTSSFGLAAFDAATLSTNNLGIAQVSVNPKSSSSNGADEVNATVTVGGVTVTKTFVVQVSSSTLNAPPVLQTALSSTSISSATPATVTATLADGRGTLIAGEVVTFSVVRGLAKTNIATALTDALGRAVVVLTPTSSSIAGADEVVAVANYAGTTLQSSKGFQIQATNVTLSNFVSAISPLGPYGQTTLTLDIAGASVSSPVNVNISSACVSLGKATLSPATFTATGGQFSMQYKDNGCGALQLTDKLVASITGGSGSVPLTLPITAPGAASLAFVSASPEVIYLKGSGFTEASSLIFEVRDGANNPLQNKSVTLSLLTRTGGVTMEGGTADVIRPSDASGRVSVRVNSGSVPTPVRVSATLTGVVPVIATVSSNLSVAVGFPSQLNFSLSQGTINIEGWNSDGILNTYTIIASDRNGNPVPNGTSINFITESGQIEPIVRTSGSPVDAPSSAVATAKFQSSSPRPADGRFTVTVYALGEESFLDQNGNNSYDQGEPFQDLGNLFKDRILDGVFDSSVDEFIPTDISNSATCLTPSGSAPVFNIGTGMGTTPVTSALLALDPSIPTVGGATCDGKWSGAGKVYVRRAVESILSTSAARVLWSNTSGLDSSCQKLALQNAPAPTSTSSFTQVQGGETWYGSGGSSLFLNFTVADANTFPRNPGAYPLGVNDPLYLFGSLSDPVGRLNPMAAGTTVTVSTPTTGLKVSLGGGSPVPSTSEATTASIGVTFDTVSSGVVFVTFTSPRGLATTYAINVRQTNAGKVGSCP